MGVLNKFYDAGKLNGDLPQKAIKFFIKMKLIDSKEVIGAVAGRASMGVFYEAIIVTNKQLVYFSKDLSMKQRQGAVSLASITGVSIESMKFGTRYLCLSLGGSQKLLLMFPFAPDDLNKLYNFIMEAVAPKDNVLSTVNMSVADEIVKFKNLLDSGIITQEEFEAKKRQLLGI